MKQLRNPHKEVATKAGVEEEKEKMLRKVAPTRDVEPVENALRDEVSPTHHEEVEENVVFEDYDYVGKKEDAPQGMPTFLF